MATQALLADQPSQPSKSPIAQKAKGYGSISSSSDDALRDNHCTAKGGSYASASWWSKLFFSYANPVMAVGNTRQLNQDDLWELEGENKTSEAYAKFKTQYLKHNQSVTRALFATYGWHFFLCGMGSLVMAACGVFAPVVLHHVIDAFSAPEVDMDDLVLWLGAFFLSRLINGVVNAHIHFNIEIVMIRFTVSLKSLIFEKAMRRSVQSKHEADTVDISNLFTSDMENFIWLSYSINSLWILPIQIVVVVYLLYSVLGLAAFAGAAVMGLSLLLNYFVSKSYSDTYEGLTDVKDNRMKAVKEVFGAIQIVKLNAWEGKFLEKIRSWRAQEVSLITRYMYMVALAVFLFWSTPIFVSIASFATYALVMKQTLTAAKVFTSMMLFNAISDSISGFPEAIQALVQSRISLRRVDEFLNSDEIDRSRISYDSSGYDTQLMASLEDVTLSWIANGDDKETMSDAEESNSSQSTSTAPILSNVNLQVKKGEFVVIHGAVGAGKSSLCSALLGEIPLTSGKIFLRSDSVAYYSQQPWIQNMSVRDNILFGQAFDADKYARVLDACGLVTDLEQLPAGDATEIGQKGINLSGGQNARLSLARACYSDADLFILDSPLAAVDAVVQSEIFRKCLCGLLESKTVILVTHNPEIIHSEAVDVRVLVGDGVAICERAGRKQARHLYGDLKLNEDSVEAEEADTEAVKVVRSGVLVEDEERQAGRVSSSVFKACFYAFGGFKGAAAYLTVITLWQTCQVSSDLWLSRWTGSKDQSISIESVKYNLKVYALLGVATSVLVLFRVLLRAVLGLRAARYLFDKLTQSLLHAPLRFFDANPIGRIINRYAQDVAQVDINLQHNVFNVIVTFFVNTFRILTAMYVIKNAAILIIPLGWIYFRIGFFYLAPSREITRLLKVAKSPVLSYVTMCEEGVTVLRGFGCLFMNRAIKQNFKLIDTSNRAWYAEALVNQWFAIRIQLLGCVFIALVVSSLVWLKDVLSPGMVGLAFMYAVSVDGELAALISQWSELELAMVSPERMVEYIGIAPEGQDKIVTFDAPASQWPKQGSVTFDNVVFSYRPSAALVLKGVSFEIRHNEKVGIVGRTGAGKSSLTMALFRINELSSGRIVIDGVDISSVSLSALRSRLSIIPQSPVLFKGTMRSYMDPFEEYSDVQIWGAFEKVGLKELVGNLENKLAHELSENGENFSVGERQMLCLARALLCQSRVVVMDEATASIDHATEKRLQSMIAREFADATVLTIAHRLATVLESDRILVLDDGKVVEFGAPRSLVQTNVGGVFYELAREGGYLSQLSVE